MSIPEIYTRFVSATENSVLVESLRQLSLLVDPKSMFENEETIEWNIWMDSSEGLAAGRA